MHYGKVEKLLETDPCAMFVWCLVWVLYENIGNQPRTHLCVRGLRKPISNHAQLGMYTR